MDTNEKILTIIKEKGPILPVKVSKEINDNILMTSARLSELLTAKQIKISNLKVGGSPLYYFSGQENKLQNFVDNLNGTEKKAYELLGQNKILRDFGQEPAIRVALRQIKDFAVPLQVNYENKIEIFWKWYLTDNKEAEILIKNKLSIKRETIPRKTIEKPAEKTTQEKLLEERKQEIKKLSNEDKNGSEMSETQGVSEHTQKSKISDELKTPQKDAAIKKPRKAIDKNIFLKTTHDFFNRSKINIIEKYDTKKGSETDFIIGLQTTIGNIKYFCKSKNKKKISDSDLSTAVIQAQSKNLPLLFLTNGDLTKKAQEMLNKEFKNITIKKI
jgi:hypothetical protein|tara:strand:- start:13078 stop:14067 length:990 start_codon:yes stop_codon:yes gene_type:complete